MKIARSHGGFIQHCCDRLWTTARRMLQKHPGVGRWSDTDDVLQQSLMRLHRGLATVRPESVRKFYGLAATNIGRELIDLGRSYDGPWGIGTEHDTDGGKAADEQADNHFDPESLAAWAEFHESFDQPVEAEQVFFRSWVRRSDTGRRCSCFRHLARHA
ncbi:sigma factor [Lignipirellula cremea]|uniref:sigma factor n=1 Tax=Lignipirellula cremea TaxID=2528010 RepID=UPI0021BCA0B8|nr:sigma factor [Lignipirellula cremea]